MSLYTITKDYFKWDKEKKLLIIKKQDFLRALKLDVIPGEFWVIGNTTKVQFFRVGFSSQFDIFKPCQLTTSIPKYVQINAIRLRIEMV